MCSCKNKIVCYICKMRFLHKTVFFLLALTLSSASLAQFQSNSLLSSGKWHKATIHKTGVYFLEKAQLAQLGFTDIAAIRLFSNQLNQLSANKYSNSHDGLKQIPTLLEDERLYFFAEADYKFQNGDLIKNHYEAHNYVFITQNAQLEAKRIPSIAQSSTENASNLHTRIWLHDEDALSIHNRGELLFETKILKGNKRSYFFQIEDTPSSPVTVTLSYCSQNEHQSNQLRVQLNEQSQLLTSQSQDLKLENQELETRLNGTSLRVEINPQEKPIYLNYIAIKAKLPLQYRSEQLPIRVENSGSSSFRINTRSPLKVWSIKSVFEVKEASGRFTQNTQYFTKPSSAVKMWAFRPQEAFALQQFTPVPNQNLHALESAQLVVVSPKEFLTEATRLANYRNTQSRIETLVVTTEQIYNEYSNGKYSPVAIRNFLKHLFQKNREQEGKKALQYLLLFGDGSFNNRKANASNSIPVFNSVEAVDEFESFVSDDFYALLQTGSEGDVAGDSPLQLATGRLPIESLNQAKLLVDKIINYETSTNYTGLWRQTVCLLADDDDHQEQVHIQNAEKTAKVLGNSRFRIKKIYLDAYKQEQIAGQERYPRAKQDLLQTIRSGCFFLNYQGHGSPKRLAHESVLEKSDIERLTNKTKLPIVVAGTCDFAAYHNPQEQSAGEVMLLNKNGGAIALISSSKLAFTSQNLNLSYGIFEQLNTNKLLRLGDVLKRVKNQEQATALKDKFMLLGDPCLRILKPSKSLILQPQTKTLMEQQLLSFKAKWHTTPTPPLQFNTQVWGRRERLKTLDNEENGFVQTYLERTRLLHQGQGKPVASGLEFQIALPAKLTPNQNDSVWLQIRAESSDTCWLFHQQFKTNLNPNPQADADGPRINLQIAGETIENEAQTHSSPVLNIQLFDPSGLLVSHDSLGPSLLLNGKEILIGNHYVGTSSFSGTIQFTLPELPNGKYKLSIKARDIFQNLSKKELTLNIKDKFELKELLPYPNPYREVLNLRLKHNREHELIESIRIQVFDLLGRKQLEETQQLILTEATNKLEVQVQHAAKLAAGTYVIRLRLTRANGATVNKSAFIVRIK